MKSFIHEAIVNLEKANADLDPDLLSAAGARDELEAYARAEKLVAYGKTLLARRVRDAEVVAKASGTSVGKAKATLDASEALAAADEVREAFKGGEVSLDQATEIARAEVAAPGSGSELLKVAETESFQVLRERSRQVVLEAEQHRGLAERQRSARSARSYEDPLGMININLRLQPHIGTPLVNRAQAEAARLHRAAKKQDEAEPFERHLADAYAKMLAGGPVKGPAKRPELVVLVSHEVAKRGWSDVLPGEVCKIPGVGPIAPEVARELAEDAFLTGLFYDGTDLRHLKRWTRNTPVEVRIALELGEPPRGGLGRTAEQGGFEGVKCVVCGRRFRPEFDHDEPHIRGGPASIDNLPPHCHRCHKQKTERDRKAGKLKPP